MSIIICQIVIKVKIILFKNLRRLQRRDALSTCAPRFTYFFNYSGQDHSIPQFNRKSKTSDQRYVHDIAMADHRDRLGQWGAGDNTCPPKIPGLERLKSPGLNKVKISKIYIIVYGVATTTSWKYWQNSNVIADFPVVSLNFKNFFSWGENAGWCRDGLVGFSTLKKIKYPRKFSWYWWKGKSYFFF